MCVLLFGNFHEYLGLVFKYELEDSGPWKLGMYLVGLICGVHDFLHFQNRSHCGVRYHKLISPPPPFIASEKRW